ncbi:hypothetical protein LUZ61_005352 [Rhynchospora tenuis]|uniref:S1 motif domain-containing protein n=1 Tax=Rhynchospora tenuis TaxID=198213 RepID=A0AAD5ZPG9_9POAL|nr:hypothetical protein LUZ61_005352 [Rhynchospora tenuis]
MAHHNNTACRMYEARYPDVGMVVMVSVKRITDVGVYVSLIEYNNIEGMILLSELDRHRIRSVSSLVKVGQQFPVNVLRVDRDKGYVDMSKRKVSMEDVQECEERYGKSKLVHSIMRHVAETLSANLEDLYTAIGWPLYHKYGHAYDAFKLIAKDPDPILDSLTREVKEVCEDGEKAVPLVSHEVKNLLVKNIRHKMASQPVKICATVEIKCYQFDGVLHIQRAMTKAQGAGNEDCPVKMALIAAPLYVISTQTLDKNQGLLVIANAIKTCSEEIEACNGKLLIKEAPRVVSEREEMQLLSEEEDGTNMDDEV